MKKKKVVHVIGGLNRGGAETMLINLYRNIDKELFEFYFIVYYSKNEHQDYEKEIKDIGGKIINVSSKNQIDMFFKILKILKQEQFDIIHAHTLFNSSLSILAAKLANIPIRITHSHSTGQMKKENFLMKLYMKVSRYLINRYSTVYIACGVDAGNYLFSEKVFSKYGRVFRNGIDLDIFKPKKNEGYYDRKEIINVLCVGSFYKVKNQIYLVKLAKYLKDNQIKNITFNLVGKGNLENYIRNEVNNNNLENYFNFLGTREDISDLMNDNNVLVMPSLYEGLPVTLIEAQASGLPCIISKNISKESDMDLGIMTKLNINEENIASWYECILKYRNKHLTDKERNYIYETITNNGYNIKKTVLLLEEIYLNG